MFKPMKLQAVAICIALCLLVPAGVGAGSIDGAFTPINAYSAGVGFAGVGTPTDPSTVYWNPAGLSLIDQMAVQFTLAAPGMETPGSWAFLVANSSSGEGSCFGLALLRHQAHRDGAEFKSFQVNAPLAYGFKAGRFPVGITFKFISESVAGGDWRYGLAFDLGTIAAAPGGFTVALTCFNAAGSGLSSFKSQNWLGFSWGNPRAPVRFAAQVRVDRLFASGGSGENFSLGADLRTGGKVPALRTGILKRDGETYLTFGFAYQRKRHRPRLEYTLILDPDGWKSRAHLLTYNYSFRPEASKPSAGPIW